MHIKLTDSQQAAVEYIGTPTLVVAGAGSGKTRTLTSKIAYLVNKGYDPGRILGITFTNKAAGEMKNRLVHLTGMDENHFPWVRTFHSACFKILKEHCTLLGYASPLQIYAEYSQKKTLKDVLERLDIDTIYLQSVLADISKAKNSGDPINYFENASTDYTVEPWIVYEEYEKELKSRNAVDFDNILYLTRELLQEHNVIRRNYQDFFQYILVDEYQDSNNLQEELTGLFLKDNNLFCVGDDWQAIYGFRGSNVNHFLSFKKKYKGAKIFRLEENFRSSNEIVQIANAIIEKNVDKMDKECFASHSGGRIEINGFYNESDEAVWVSRMVTKFRDMGIPYDKTAVLYRTKFCSLAFEKAFRAFSIPYKMVGAKGFFERKEVLDINCYLAAAAFSKDDTAFERIINTPRRGIGPAMLAKINGARSKDMSLQDTVRELIGEQSLKPKVHDELSRLIAVIDSIKEKKPSDAIEEVLMECQYLEYLKRFSKTDMEYTSRYENIRELTYSAQQKFTLHDYLEEVSLIKEDKEDTDENDFGVNLSTIHASKGLEYHAVFIVGCEENLFPHWRSGNTDLELQEERRLMYVAITRSEQYVYMSFSRYRRGEPSSKSRFLLEIEKIL